MEPCAAAVPAGAALTGAALHAAWDARQGQSLFIAGRCPQPWHQQCLLYLAGESCAPHTCLGRHDPLPLRPVCHRFLETPSQCPNGAACWLPHRLESVRHACTVVLQADEMHAARLLAYVREVHGAAIAGATMARAHGYVKKQDAVLLLNVESRADATTMLRALRDDPCVSLALRRCYEVQHVAALDGDPALFSFDPALLQFFMTATSVSSWRCPRCTQPACARAPLSAT